MLNNIHLAIDAGLFILIWMIQLIVYPSFKFYSEGKLLKWHEIYTTRIAIIVIPLMFGQLGFVVFNFLKNQNTVTILSLVLVILVWLVTFTKFVPLHAKIDSDNFNKKILNQLVNLNWIRTFLWTVIFLINFFFS